MWTLRRRSGTSTITSKAVEWSSPAWQILIRRVIYLLLIEGMVFGLNYVAGRVFSPVVSVILVLGIAAVFVMAYIVLWINDSKSAQLFNRKLKEYQSANKC